MPINALSLRNRKLNIISTIVNVSAIIIDSKLRKRVTYNYRTDNLHNYKIPLPCLYYDMFINAFDADVDLNYESQLILSKMFASIFH